MFSPMKSSYKYYFTIEVPIILLNNWILFYRNVIVTYSKLQYYNVQSQYSTTVIHASISRLGSLINAFHAFAFHSISDG